MQDYIYSFIQDSISTFQEVAEKLPPHIEHASTLMVNCLLNEGKILSCGNGSGAVCSQYFTSKLLNCYVQERPSLPALSLTTDNATLTAIANDYGFAEIYAKQIRALGSQKDILLAVTDHDNSVNIIEAIHAAHDREMAVIALVSASSQMIAQHLLPDDIGICIPTDKKVPLQEAQFLIMDTFCELIDYQLFGAH